MPEHCSSCERKAKRIWRSPALGAPTRPQRRNCGVNTKLRWHTFITTCADAGVPPMQLMQRAGHKDLKTTLKYYHATDEPSQRAMDAVSFEADTPPDEADPHKYKNKDNDDEKEAA